MYTCHALTGVDGSIKEARPLLVELLIALHLTQSRPDLTLRVAVLGLQTLLVDLKGCGRKVYDRDDEWHTSSAYRCKYTVLMMA